MKFSDRFLQSLKPQEKKYVVNEGRGFQLLVLPSGTKTFYIRYSYNGKQKVHKLGQYPYLTLADARIAFNECVEKIKNGVDPSSKPETEKAVEVKDNEISVGWIVQKYLEWSEINHSKEWFNINRWTLDKYLVPAWKDRPIQSINKRDAIELMEGISKIGGGAARNAQRVIRGVFSYAEDREYIKFSPINKLSKAVPTLKSVTRQRTLTQSEIKHAWNTLHKGIGDDPVRRAILLILVTGQRPDECAEITSTEIEGDWWTIPPERNKMERYHRVFLTKTAKLLIGDAEGVKFVGKDGAIDRGSMSKRISKSNYLDLPRWTPHDLRRTVRTHMARIGIPSEHAEAVINHSKEGMIAVYNLYDYDLEKQNAMLQWEAELLKILNSK